MREVLFRGKQIDNGDWIEGYYLKADWNGKEISAIIPQNTVLYSGNTIDSIIEIDPKTLCQYTGMNDKKAEWNTIKDDGLPPVGSCLIVTIKNHGYGGRRELRYPVHYLQKNYAAGYAFYMNGTDILLPEYSEVVAWMDIPMPYEGE